MNKPLIRHCKNCIWATKWVTIRDTVRCNVFYKFIDADKQRKTALLCRHYCKVVKTNEPKTDFLDN